jgi:hypothetical protein
MGAERAGVVTTPHHTDALMIMTRSLHERAPLLITLAIAACGHGAATPSPPTPSTGAQQQGLVPAQVERYRLTRRDAIEGFPGDTAYHFSDGSATILTVIVFAIPADVQVGPDSQSWTAREGKKFMEAQPILAQRRRIDAYEPAFMKTDTLTIGGRVINEHATAVVVRSRGRVVVDFQYLYLVAGRFLKVRATVPSEGWERTDVPIFARAMARHIAQIGDRLGRTSQ